MKTILSAVQPSNRLTLGNYLGALKGWAEMQLDYECLFFVVDLHAITVRQDPKALRTATYEALATYLAAGIDPSKALLFVQSHVSQHAELGWILTCFSSMGELGRMTQFKSKIKDGSVRGAKDKTAKLQENEGIGVGLFLYPVLMAADILLYQTELVPVGDDQRQHLQLARDLAIRFNHTVGENVFKVPEPVVPKVGARIMSLQDPTKKMSKSDPDPGAAVFLSDSDDVIARKIKRAVTDSGTEVEYNEDTKPGIANLIQIYAAVTSQPIENVINEFAGKQYGKLKVAVADATVAAIRPIRNKAKEILTDEEGLRSILLKGAQGASGRASVTLERVREVLGFVPAWYTNV
jgi:tryptophanyl-tRNA synthetase